MKVDMKDIASFLFFSPLFFVPAVCRVSCLLFHNYRRVKLCVEIRWGARFNRQLCVRCKCNVSYSWRLL